MRHAPADRLVVAVKSCNGDGAKGPAHLWFVRASNQGALWEETSGQVRSGRQTVSDTEAAGVGGIQERQGQQGCRRSGWAVHRGVRGRSEEQSLPDLESDVLGDLFSTSGAGGRNTEAAWRWDENSGYSHRHRQDRANGGRDVAGASDGVDFP